VRQRTEESPELMDYQGSLHSTKKRSNMRTTIAATCIVLGALLAPALVHAADGDKDRKHPITFVKDSAITTKVKAKLAAEKMSSLAKIHVDTDAKGMVVLSGKVKTRAEADKAGSIATETEGVTSVRNDIKVRKSS